VHLTHSYNIAADTVADYVYQAWAWRHMLQTNLNNHTGSILIQYLSDSTNTDTSVIISQLRDSLNRGDNILIDEGWDLVAGPLRPQRSDIIHHVGLLRAR
jgi:hypothetical protein